MKKEVPPENVVVEDVGYWMQQRRLPFSLPLQRGMSVQLIRLGDSQVQTLSIIWT